MKKIKIFALPSHQTEERTSGVDMVRIIQPMKYLNGYKDKDTEFEVTTFDISKRTDWINVAKTYDIIYLNYIANPWGFAAMGAMARKHGVKLVLDLDDNLWGIREDNPAHAVYHKGSQALQDFVSICNEVDFMTVTSSYLKNVVVNNTYKKHDKISVFPNYIDLDLYKHQSPFKNTLNIQLMHHGSTTHFEDLSNNEFIRGVNKIMEEYPNVTIRFVGAFLPKLKELWGQRYDTAYGDSDIYKWVNEKFPQYMDEADILVVPLEVNSYTRCKSDIKFLETSSAKIPGVYQKIRQYEETIEDGKDGYLAETSQEWYEKLKILIDSPTIRQRMGEAAYRKVKETKQIQNHIKEYAEFFKSVLDKEK
jgi:glycosyltransferase involved in cell wall biosynthesis